MADTKQTRFSRPRDAKRQRAGAAHLMVAIDRRTRVPLQCQIYASIRQGILGGHLPPGTRLPASRTTVVLAYEALETEGYISGRGSAGSFVAMLGVEQRGSRASKRATRDGT